MRFASLLLIAAATVAQTLPSRDLSIVTGRGELLTFDRDLQRVVVSEPKIADAVVVSPREVMVNAKGAGKASVIVWESGSPPIRYNVDVHDDTSTFERATKALETGLGPAIKVDRSGDAIILTGSVKDADEAKRATGLAAGYAKNVVNLLQVPPAPEPRQILLQVKFATIDRVGLSELGFNYFSANGKTLGGLTSQQFQGPRFTQLQFENQNFSNAGLNFADLLNIFAFRPDLNIGATIRALQSRNLLQILAEPNLITMEGKEASFLAGGSFPFPTIAATTTGGAVAPVVTVQFKPFGVRLFFTPNVTASGAIHLKVAPEVSSLDFANAVTIQGFLIPALAERRAETEVTLRDGESFAIAGLIDNRVIQTLARVRGLGDIPFLGQLFRSRSTRKSTDELLVVITPRFVRPLSAEEHAQLPDMQEAFLPTIEETKNKKGKKQQPKPAGPEFVGPRGHQEPQQEKKK